MTRNQSNFFATKADLDSLLRAIESTQQLQFVMTGLFDSPNVDPIESLLTVPTLGYMEGGDANQSPAYLVATREIPVEMRPVPQRSGGIKYAVDQLANPTTVLFRPGGLFGERCLIAGQVGTVSENPGSLDIFQTFKEELRRQFTNVKSYYVGKEAAELLDKGFRLTSNAKSPLLYDLKPG